MWHYENVILDSKDGWGSIALFHSDAIVGQHDGRKIVNSSKCAIFVDAGWDGTMTQNDEVVKEIKAGASWWDIVKICILVAAISILLTILLYNRRR